MASTFVFFNTKISWALDKIFHPSCLLYIVLHFYCVYSSLFTCHFNYFLKYFYQHFFIHPFQTVSKHLVISGVEFYRLNELLQPLHIFEDGSYQAQIYSWESSLAPALSTMPHLLTNILFLKHIRCTIYLYILLLPLLHLWQHQRLLCHGVLSLQFYQPNIHAYHHF